MKRTILSTCLATLLLPMALSGGLAQNKSAASPQTQASNAQSAQPLWHLLQSDKSRTLWVLEDFRRLSDGQMIVATASLFDQAHHDTGADAVVSYYLVDCQQKNYVQNSVELMARGQILAKKPGVGMREARPDMVDFLRFVCEPQWRAKTAKSRRAPVAQPLRPAQLVLPTSPAKPGSGISTRAPAQKSCFIERVTEPVQTVRQECRPSTRETGGQECLFVPHTEWVSKDVERCQ